MNIKNKIIIISSGILFSGLSLAGLDARVDLHSQLKIDVLTVQKTLMLNQAKWTAGANWVAELPRSQIQRMLGSLDHPALKDAQFQSFSKLKGLATPPAFDLRDVQGTNFVSPVLNQGNCGSCVSFAAVATLETQMNVASGAARIYNPHYSTQALFACGGGACDWGWYPGSAARYLQTSGVPDEACAPYISGATGNDVACSTICRDSAERSTKTIRTISPSSDTMSADAVKLALTRGPLMTTLSVYEDFVTYTSGVYRHVTGEMIGGHAVSLVGYNDQGRYWIVRNSWGPDWGEHGFIRVSYDDVSGIASSTWGFEVTTPVGFLKVENPEQRSFVSDTLAANVVSTYPQIESLHVTLKSVTTSRQVLDQSCAAAPCTPSIDTLALEDGEYEMTALALNAGAKVSSQPQRFFVVNHVSPMTIEFSGKGVDLTQPVSDRIEFNVKIASGAVPLNRLTFHAKKMGDENAAEFKKETPIVLAEMTMGWRTPAVTDGAYEIWFSGEQPVRGQMVSVESSRMQVKVQNH